MKSSQAITHLRAGGGGANISNLNQKVLDSLCVPVPSHRVQAEIVQQLGDLNTVCSQLRQSIACKIADLADLRQSLLQKAFAGELT
jgi:type I restriction enzyme S subunit